MGLKRLYILQVFVKSYLIDLIGQGFLGSTLSKACKKISTLNEPTSVKTFPMHRNAQFEKDKKLKHVKW